MDTIAQALLDQLLPSIRQAVRDELKLFSGGQAKADPEQPLNISDAAAFLNRPPAALYQLVHKGEIPHSKRNRRLYFFKADLITWLKQANVKTLDQVRQDADSVLTK